MHARDAHPLQGVQACSVEHSADDDEVVLCAISHCGLLTTCCCARTALYAKAGMLSASDTMKLKIPMQWSKPWFSMRAMNIWAPGVILHSGVPLVFDDDLILP